MKKLYLHLPSPVSEDTEHILATIAATLTPEPCASTYDCPSTPRQEQIESPSSSPHSCQSLINGTSNSNSKGNSSSKGNRACACAQVTGCAHELADNAALSMANMDAATFSAAAEESAMTRGAVVAEASAVAKGTAVAGGAVAEQSSDAARAAEHEAHDAAHAVHAAGQAAFAGDRTASASDGEVLGIEGSKVIGYYKDRVVAVVDDRAAEQLRKAGAAASALISKHGYEAFEMSEYVSLLGDGDALIGMEKGCLGMALLLQAKMKPLVIDFEQLQYRQRLLRGGRQKEPLARAVMNGIEDGALVFDATAGLGRESMILAHAGARVISFERQLPIWIILKDALLRASKSRFFPFTLPMLQAPGSIADYTGDEPEVIYYDPMFPEREKSAVVKKDMFLFRQVIGEDKDIEDFIRIALKLAKKRVVVKRPSTAEPVCAPDFERAYFVDGGQCRFDCYKPD